MSTVIDEKELRKAWLKRKFGSWEYHEELLKLHDEYLSALHKHWGRPEIQKQFPSDFKSMKSPVFFNFDKVQKPGEIPKPSWKAGKESGWANAISYNFNRGMDFAGCNEYAGMPDDQIQHLNKLVGLMLDHCTNIRRTAEATWEKNDSYTILDEEYTGPIDWPPNWREDITRELGAASATPSVTRCEGGQPCPRSGYWWTPARKGSRQRFTQGEIMPDYPASSYGVTIWQWDAGQANP
jgi:hypothetical protein